MAVDRLGNAVATGQVYALAGTARFVDGDDVVLVVGDRGEHALRCKAGDIVKANSYVSRPLPGATVGAGILNPAAQSVGSAALATWQNERQSRQRP